MAEMIENGDLVTAKQIEIKIAKRLQRHGSNPVFRALGERLEQLREQHELGLLSSIDFLNDSSSLERRRLPLSAKSTPGKI
jgi:hypothetical protein